MDFKIRKEAPEDHRLVREILCAAFPTEAESKLVDALRANGKAVISLVAVNKPEVLGHIMFSAVSTSPPSAAKGIGLAPVAVRPDVHSKGIGSQLIRQGIAHCEQLDIDYCVVPGDPKYYERFGFEKASRHGLRNEYGVDDEFMVIRFRKTVQAEGIVKYAPEFAVLSL